MIVFIIINKRDIHYNNLKRTVRSLTEDVNNLFCYILLDIGDSYSHETR